MLVWLPTIWMPTVPEYWHSCKGIRRSTPPLPVFAGRCYDGHLLFLCQACVTNVFGPCPAIRFCLCLLAETKHGDQNESMPVHVSDTADVLLDYRRVWYSAFTKGSAALWRQKVSWPVCHMVLWSGCTALNDSFSFKFSIFTTSPVAVC